MCSVADALREEDEVLVGQRKRPLTVVEREQDLGLTLMGQSPDYPYEHIWLEGNGTRYRIRYSHTGEHHPFLYTRSQLQVATSNFQHPDFDDNFLVSQEPSLIPKSGERSERVRSLLPVEVESGEDLIDFVLSRNIEVVQS